MATRYDKIMAARIAMHSIMLRAESIIKDAKSFDATFPLADARKIRDIAAEQIDKLKP
jgi:hypothetical protein